MKLFNRIPDRFFSILASQKKELYVQALFVLRQTFKTELVIRREDLVGMLIDSLEEDFENADFSEEAGEEAAGRTPAGADDPGGGAANPSKPSAAGRAPAGADGPGGGAANPSKPSAAGRAAAEIDDSSGSADNLSGKAYLLLRKLRETGWIETEFEPRSFDELITIPDYAISVMNLLYELSEEKVREYNSYVYATYAALTNVKENRDFVYQALNAAWQNTVHLIDELKSLFNNIRRYYARIPSEEDVNALLAEHFDEYKAKVVDMVYYPLKTIDSVPRFKHSIISTLNGWLLDEEIQRCIVEQGVARRVFENEEEGRERMLAMIGFIADTYDGIEEMLDAIDRRHTEYINASVEHMRYLMNADKGVRGNLVELLRHSGDPETMRLMSGSVMLYRHQYYDEKSLYAQAKRTKRAMGAPRAIEEKETPTGVVDDFLSGVRRQYTDRKIDGYVLRCFGNADSFSTMDAPMETTEDFILFLLSTIRAREKSADFTVEFGEGNCLRNGCSLPEAVFRRKKKKRGFQ